ncbi:MAG: NUDIX hydrolase [Alphaproteobacteria bacterium]|nr:NUDIX hydrolase [Alphaproteobacteria bacterium]
MQKLFEGRYLRILDDNGWEFAQRTGVSGVVVILAVTDDDRVLLVEQYRKPVKARVLELPAGLAGDLAGAEDEALVTAAARELLEETGYEASDWVVLGEAPVSAGLSDETVMFFLARGLRKVGPGGGDESEDIEVFEVPRAELRKFIAARQAYGTKVDAKIGGGLWMAAHLLD